MDDNRRWAKIIFKANYYLFDGQLIYGNFAPYIELQTLILTHKIDRK